MIRDFTKEEKKALIAVAKFIANQDNKLSDAELEQFTKLSEQPGFGDFHAIFKAVDKEVRTLNDLSHAVNVVVRREIQEEIVALALAMAEADGVESPATHDVVRYLCRVWDIPVENVRTPRDIVLVSQVRIFIRGAIGSD